MHFWRAGWYEHFALQAARAYTYTWDVAAHPFLSQFYQVPFCHPCMRAVHSAALLVLFSNAICTLRELPNIIFFVCRSPRTTASRQPSAGQPRRKLRSVDIYGLRRLDARGK